MTGTVVTLSGRVSVGSDPANDFVLPDAGVEPHHFFIRLAPRADVAASIHAAARTFVNGLPVVEKALAPGDSIHVGGSVLVLRASAGDAAVRPLDPVIITDLPGTVVERQVRVAELLASPRPGS